MIRGKKIRLKPTKEQERKFWQSAGVARWAYNYFLNENEQRGISESKVRRYINNVLKKTTHKWLNEVSSNVMKQAVKEADRFYASSKLCSECAKKKEDLKLSDRTYKCSECGLTIDRDLNAAKNLEKYPTLLGNKSLWRVKKSSFSEMRFGEAGR